LGAYEGNTSLFCPATITLRLVIPRLGRFASITRMIIFGVGFVLSSFLMIGFIQLHCAPCSSCWYNFDCDLQSLFSSRVFFICLVSFVATAIYLIFLETLMFKSLFEVNITEATEKVEVCDKLRM
jgi:hypothetical protein